MSADSSKGKRVSFPRRSVMVVTTYSAIVLVSLSVSIGGILLYDASNHPISWAAVPIYLSGQSMFQPDSRLGYVARPNLVAANANPALSYYTNARSARVAGPNMPVPTHVDVVSVGCSQTMGQGVASDDTFTGVLQREFGLTGQNFGISGYGGVGSLLILRRALDLKPRAIIYGFWEDHLNRNVRPCLESGMPFCTPRPIVDTNGSTFGIRLPADPLTALASARRWYGHGGPTIFKDVAAAAARNWARLKIVVHSSNTGIEPSWSTKIDVSIFVLKAMKVAADSVGAKLIVVYIPGSQDLPGKIRDFIHGAGIHLVDMGPSLERMRREGIPTQIPNDGHMTAAVHRAIAEEAAKIVRERD